MTAAATDCETLSGALGLGPRELVALVGGGGKTGALHTLAGELAAAGGRVVVATTTAMFVRELAVVGPLLTAAGEKNLAGAVREALRSAAVVAVAQGYGADAKVVGLPPGAVDVVWAAAGCDYLLVEADGSRGRSLKAFAPYEPQVPAAAGTVVQLAGLDALGAPLDDVHAHRAAELAALLARPAGSEVTPAVFAASLRAQLPRLRQAAPAARVVAVLNKAEAPEGWAAGLAVAEELWAEGRVPDVRSGESEGRFSDAGPGGGEPQAPDGIVIASLRERRFARVSMLEG
jgi:probable selenium-dependent hydroxylase accessory protein YqeC